MTSKELFRVSVANGIIFSEKNGKLYLKVPPEFEDMGRELIRRKLEIIPLISDQGFAGEQTKKTEPPPGEIAQMIFETKKPYSCNSVDHAEKVRNSLLDLLRVKGLFDSYSAGYQIEGNHISIWKK